jgi:hypothetical protein
MRARATILLVRAALPLALVAACAAPSAAQSAPSPPFRPVFGTMRTSTTGTLFDLRMDVGEAYDQNVLENGVGVLTSPFTMSGAYTAMDPAFDLSFRGRRAQLAIGASSDLRHYPSLNRVIATTHAASARLTAQPGSNTSLTTTETVVYSPSYLYNLFASVTPVAATALGQVAPNYSVDDQRSYSTSTNVQVEQNLTPRAVLSMTGSARQTNFVNLRPGYTALREYDGGSGFSYSLNRSTKARVSYTYRDATYSPTLHPREHDMEVGIEHRRQLSPSRFAVLTANIGPRLLTLRAPGSDPTAESGGYTTRLTGDAGLNYQMNRTWHLAANYRRGLTFVETLPGPVFSDGLTTTARGYFNRRLEAAVSAGFSHGELEFGRTIGSVITYTGDVRAQFALSRVTAVYTEYVRYYYDLAEEIALPAAFPHHLSRNSIRAGLTLWAPIETGRHAAR